MYYKLTFNIFSYLRVCFNNIHNLQHLHFILIKSFNLKLLL